jgi:hypothetical protein
MEHTVLEQMSDEHIEGQLKWMKRRQYDMTICSLPGEDRSYKINKYQEEKDRRIAAGEWSIR